MISVITVKTALRDFIQCHKPTETLLVYSHCNDLHAVRQQSGHDLLETLFYV